MKVNFSTNRKLAREAALKRWRNQRGLRIVVSIMPFKNGSRATALFEGMTFVGTGKDNTEAFKNLTDSLSHYVKA